MTRSKKLAVEREEHGELAAVVYRLGGRLVGTPEDYEFLETVRDDIADGRNHLIFELSGMDWMNSTGVGIVAAAYTSASKAGGTLAVVAVPESVARLFDVVCLRPMLVEYATVGEALAVLS